MKEKESIKWIETLYETEKRIVSNFFGLQAH